jgi:ankyrin repeat protein
MTSSVHDAVARRDIPALRALLLEHAKNPSEVDDWGLAPLHLIVPEYPEDLDIVDILVSFGANVDAQAWTYPAPTPLHFHQRHHHARCRFKTALIQKLLNHGADPDLEDVNGVTPLGLAIQRGDAAIVDMMLAARKRRPIDEHLIRYAPNRNVWDVLVHNHLLFSV